MSGCWSNQEFSFYGGDQGHQSHYIERNQMISKKTYLNPQVVNYEYVKKSLSKRSLQRNNKIHVNPNFKANILHTVSAQKQQYLISAAHLESESMFFCEPGTSNTCRTKEEKDSVNPWLVRNDRFSNIRTEIPFQSRYKKVNAATFRNTNKSLYTWCKNKTNEKDVCSSVKKQSEAPGVKSNDEKLIGFKHNQSIYKYTSLKVRVNQNCSNPKKWLLYNSQTEVNNKCKTKSLSNNCPKSKLHFKERRLNTSYKKYLNLKLAYFNNKHSAVLRIAKAVRSKYKYLNSSEIFKKSYYKIDKRNKLPESFKKKSNSKEVKDIRKLFPNYLYNKMKISPYHMYNLNRCKAVPKNNCLISKSQIKDKVKKKMNQFHSRRVVKIGGILYKSTTTKLTLASQKVETNCKKTISNGSRAIRNYIVYVRGEKFILENNGRALRRQFDSGITDKTTLLTPKRIDIGGVTFLRKSKNVLIRTNVHQARHFVNKARNKSIALLANLRKRSSMPCMIYHRFGKCIRHTKGLCMYKHDSKNIAVCKKFLKGDCSDNNCLLSHQVIQEKMATCHFFLKGLCAKENCPFLHVKLNQSTAICKNFLQGFCNFGKECSKRHLHQCPEFDQFGSCKLGLKCHYPHRKFKIKEIPDQKKTESLCDNQANQKDECESVQYYIHSGFQKKQKKSKESILKGKEIISTKNKKFTIEKDLSVNGSDSNNDIIECFPKRIKLDKLPCFIPLDSES